MDRRSVRIAQQGHTARPRQRRLRRRAMTVQRIHIPVPGAWMKRIALAGKATP